MSYADINRVVLVGRLARDPELRALPSGTTVCGLRIVCNTIRKDKGVREERHHYFDVFAFGALGRTVERNLHEGSRVALAGRLDWREWETADKQKHQLVSVVANSIQFLDPPADSQHGEDEDDDTLNEDDE
jgi:single-strand DNA-binding protein